MILLLYSGDDGLTLPVLAIGGVGVVSVALTCIGNEMQEMVDTFLTGNLKEAAKLHQQLLPIIKGFFAAPSPVLLKQLYSLKELMLVQYDYQWFR